MPSKKKIFNDEVQYFSIWKKKLKKKKCLIFNYKKVGKIYRKKEKQFLVSLYDTEIKSKNSDKIKRFITIVKPSVIIIPLLYFEKKIYTMLVSQTRIYDGSEIKEFPAGSIDFGQKPIDAAINELKEELHLDVKRKDLVKPYKKPIMIEPSCTSNASHFFYFKKKINKDFFSKFHLRRTGDKSAGERIKIHIKKIDDIFYYNSASIHVGLNLIRKFIN